MGGVVINSMAPLAVRGLDANALVGGGIVVTGAAGVDISDTVIVNAGGTGISAPSTAVITDSQVRRNSGNGVSWARRARSPA